MGKSRKDPAKSKKDPGRDRMRGYQYVNGKVVKSWPYREPLGWVKDLPGYRERGKGKRK